LQTKCLCRTDIVHSRELDKHAELMGTIHLTIKVIFEPKPKEVQAHSWNCSVKTGNVIANEQDKCIRTQFEISNFRNVLG
jgi:hypothetical protein